MKVLTRLAVISTALAFALVLGCGGKSSTEPKTDPAAAAGEVDAGNTALANGDYAAANEHFKTAIAKDPSNAQAQFGAAVTEVYLLQDDPELQSLAGQFQLFQPGALPVSHGRLARRVAFSQRVESLRSSVVGPYTPGRMGAAVVRTLALAGNEPDSISEIQAIVRTKVMPKLQYAEDRLNAAEAAADFRMFIDPAVTGLPDTLEIDKTELYLLDSVINGVQGWLGILTAYNFDVENSDFEHVNAESLLAPGTTWATLHPYGHLALAQAKNDFETVKARFDAAAAYLANESDDQANDLIPQEWLSTQDYADLADGIDQMYAALTGPILVPARDANDQEFDLQVDLGRFLVPGIDDLKKALPNHTFENGELKPVEPITFSTESGYGGPTVYGIFPDMTDARWQQLTGLTGPPPTLRATR